MTSSTAGLVPGRMPGTSTSSSARRPGRHGFWPDAARVVVVFALLAATLFPLYFMVVTSLKSQYDLSRNYFLPPQFGVLLSNWLEVLPVIAQPVLNSLIVSLGTVLLVLLLVTPLAYAFTWHRFPGKEALFSVVIVTIMLPSILIFVPQFILVRDLGLLDTHMAVILPGTAASIGVTAFLLRSFFAALPVELVEAARVDGASELQILLRVILPLSVPSLVTVSVLILVSAWNNFLWPLVVLPSSANRVASVAVTYFAGNPILGSDFPLLVAAYLVSSLPLIVILGGLLRYFMAGALGSAVKG